MKNSRHWDVQGGPVELAKISSFWIRRFSFRFENELMFPVKRRSRQFLSFVLLERFRLGAWKLSSRYRKWMEESVGSTLLRSSIYRGKLKIETVFRISFLLYWNKEIIVIQLYIFSNFRWSKFLKEIPCTIFYLPFLNFFQSLKIYFVA